MQCQWYLHEKISPLSTSSLSLPPSSDEDTNIKALVTGWLQSHPPSPSLSSLEGWIEDYFHQALDWVVRGGDLVVNTTVVGVAMNGLSHLVGVASKAEFACALVRGLGGNLPLPTREKFAKEVGMEIQLSFVALSLSSPPSPGVPHDSRDPSGLQETTGHILGQRHWQTGHLPTGGTYYICVRIL